MKRLLILLCAAATLAITGCESAKEITIQADGGGKVVTTTDMSSLLGLAKMQGGDQMKEMEDKVLDTTFSLGTMADSLPNISAEEKALLRKGTFAANFNLKEDKCLIRIELPFSNISQLGKLSDLSEKLMQEGMKKVVSEAGKSGESPIPLGGDEMSGGSIDSYYKITYADGRITRVLNEEKYATVGADEGMNAMKEMSQMGMGGNSTLVINLPRPAKKRKAVE